MVLCFQERLLLCAPGGSRSATRRMESACGEGVQACFGFEKLTFNSEIMASEVSIFNGKFGVIKEGRPAAPAFRLNSPID